MQNNIILAFVLTILAGLSTVLGAFLIFWVKTTCTKFLSFGLGLSAGVMIYLSFFELLKESNHLLTNGVNNGYNGLVIIMFLVGLTIAGIIDSFTHSRMEACPSSKCENMDMPTVMGNRWHGHRHRHGQNLSQQQALLKTGIFTAIIITVHNFPEGIATFTTASVSLVFGLSIAIAIAIHNIPEGFCIALPIYYATNSKKKSILYALLAGLAEPLGALLTYLILFPYINNFTMGIMLAIVAGIMVYVSFDELLPTARRYGGHMSLFGLVCGMALMAFSLYLLH
ncbi:MAG: zinc transporter ZupT [Candidatus Magasanikbacteria bacterium]